MCFFVGVLQRFDARKSEKNRKSEGVFLFLVPRLLGRKKGKLDFPTFSKEKGWKKRKRSDDDDDGEGKGREYCERGGGGLMMKGKAPSCRKETHLSKGPGKRKKKKKKVDIFLRVCLPKRFFLFFFIPSFFVCLLIMSE